MEKVQQSCHGMTPMQYGTCNFKVNHQPKARFHNVGHPKRLASTLWDILKGKYDQINDIAYNNAKRNIALCVQGEESVTSFFSNLQAAWDELRKTKELVQQFSF